MKYHKSSRLLKNVNITIELRMHVKSNAEITKNFNFNLKIKLVDKELFTNYIHSPFLQQTLCITISES